jgi:adenosylcobinamide-phosphate synthase
MAALALDAAIGDPRWLPHPVRALGALATGLEAVTRRLIPSARAAGVLTVIVVVGSAGGTVYLLVRAAAAIHPAAGDAVSIVLIAFTLAARDLAGHALNVHRALDRGDLAEGRKKAALMVGRDTAALDEAETARAAIESVAENTVDGVTAPLLFAVLGGPAAAMMYKAVNTLDSLFGYRNERYLKFGWASARLDDAVNYLPARLTAALVPVAAAITGARPVQALRCLVRDGRKHPSPNSGLTEAAMAGALGVRLGGVSSYFGKPSTKPFLGDPLEPLGTGHIRRAVVLMVATYLLAALLFLGTRWLWVRSCTGGAP